MNTSPNSLSGINGSCNEVMANSGFTRKKVESLTLGEKLKKLRGDFRMSLSDISKATKIQVKYLEYLENAQYDKLPADVYVRGFLRSYARYLNLDEKAFIKLYERERNIQANLGQDIAEPTKPRNINVSSFVITSRTVLLAAVIVLVAGSFMYLYREFSAFAAEPLLIISTPANGAVIESSEVLVKGKTDRGARVSLNNQPVFVGSDGVFEERLTLQPGLNTVTFVAINRFEKEKREILSLEATYAQMPAESVTQPLVPVSNDMFLLEVFVKKPGIRVTMEADGTVIFNGILEIGQPKTIEAKKKISISSDTGNQTFYRFSGGEEQVLSAESGSVENAIFTAAGRTEAAGEPAEDPSLAGSQAGDIE